MKRKLLALLLVFCLCFSLVVQASAEEASHNHESENQLIWSFDEAYGELYISGTGTVDPISSADEQPWAQYREQIQYVYIDQEAMYFVEDIAYWFSGCTNLVYAEIPGYWFVIGEDAFKDCANLQELLILTHGTPEIAESAFAAENPADLWIMVTSDESEAYVNAANWHGRTIDVANYANVATYDGPCGVNNCTCTSCTWYYKYDQYDETYHWKYAACTNCSAHEGLYGSRNAHTFNSSGICTLCGYEETVASCTHGRYTYSWSGCTYYQYCYYCGEYMGSGVEHGTYTYGAWNYYSSSQHRRLYSCSDCGEGSYQYGYHATSNSYAYYSSTQHSISSYCSTCATTISTTYANHSYNYGNWSSYSDTQHQRVGVCTDCGSSKTQLASHSFSYGSWSSYSSTQHRRTVSCATCGYSSYGYGDHADSNGDGKCDGCGYSMTVTVTWDAHTNGGTVNGVQSVTTSAALGYSATAPSYTPVKTGHSFKGWYTAATGGSTYTSVSISTARTFYAQFTANSYAITWDCGDGTTKTTNQTYGQALTLPADPTRENYTFSGWYTASSGGSKVTNSTVFTGTGNTTYYARWVQSFSVTVPTSLPLVMDQDGNVNASAAQIVNNSSGDVIISSVTLRGENGWKIVPYATEMAHQKVDARVVGFSLNRAATATSGEEESLSLIGDWTIPQNDSLDLDYDAVISAMSQAVENETILSAIFVLKWS